MTPTKRTKGPSRSRIHVERKTPPAAPGDIVSAVASGVAAAGGFAAGDPTGLAVGVSSAIASVRDLVSAARDVYSKWQNRRVERLLEEAYFENAPDSTVGVELATLLQHPHAQAVLIESIRASLESISEAVVPALGLLMREYQRTGKEPDVFFRGVCRVLQELTAEEYADFRRMLHEVVEAARHGAGRGDELLFAVIHEGGTHRIAVEQGVTIQPPGIVFRSPHLRRFVRLLGASELGRAVDIGLTREPVKWAIDWRLLTRLEGLLTAAA